MTGFEPKSYITVGRVGYSLNHRCSVSPAVCDRGWFPLTSSCTFYQRDLTWFMQASATKCPKADRTEYQIVDKVSSQPAPAQTRDLHHRGHIEKINTTISKIGYPDGSLKYQSGVCKHHFLEYLSGDNPLGVFNLTWGTWTWTWFMAKSGAFSFSDIWGGWGDERAPKKTKSRAHRKYSLRFGRGMEWNGMENANSSKASSRWPVRERGTHLSSHEVLLPLMILDWCSSELMYHFYVKIL